MPLAHTFAPGYRVFLATLNLTHLPALHHLARRFRVRCFRFGRKIPVQARPFAAGAPAAFRIAFLVSLGPLVALRAKVGSHPQPLRFV